MMKLLNKNTVFLWSLVALIVFVGSCKKDDYYIDSGIHSAKYDGTVMDYLEAKSGFDSLVKIIKLAGMEDVFESNTITFFAPGDSSIKSSIDLLNSVLYLEGLDTVSNLNQIPGDVWKTELSLYIFSGKHLLNSYPQLDLNEIPVFPGQAYQSYGVRTMNIGVIYHDVVTDPDNNPNTDNSQRVEYAGYRQLILSYIPSLADPYSGWFNAYVASSNIQPTNGVVHTLVFTDHFFGFSLLDFTQNVLAAGVGR